VVTCPAEGYLRDGHCLLHVRSPCAGPHRVAALGYPGTSVEEGKGSATASRCTTLPAVGGARGGLPVLRRPVNSFPRRTTRRHPSLFGRHHYSKGVDGPQGVPWSKSRCASGLRCTWSPRFSPRFTVRTGTGRSSPTTRRSCRRTPICSPRRDQLADARRASSRSSVVRATAVDVGGGLVASARAPGHPRAGSSSSAATRLDSGGRSRVTVDQPRSTGRVDPGARATMASR